MFRILSIGLLVGAAALLGAVDAASAKPIKWVRTPIKGIHGPQEIKQDCLENAGDYWTQPNGGYTCTNTNTQTSVSCTKDGHCTAIHPAKTGEPPKKTVKAFLSWSGEVSVVTPKVTLLDIFGVSSGSPNQAYNSTGNKPPPTKKPVFPHK